MVSRSVAQLLYRSVRWHHVLFAPEHGSAFCRHASQAQTLGPRAVESQLGWMQDRGRSVKEWVLIDSHLKNNNLKVEYLKKSKIYLGEKIHW
jgi:hypothetical protein